MDIDQAGLKQLQPKIHMECTFLRNEIREHYCNTLDSAILEAPNNIRQLHLAFKAMLYKSPCFLF